MLLLMVRLLSRRPGGQLTLFEFALIFLIGGFIIQATLGHDHSVTNCVTAILTVGLLHRLVSWLKQVSPRWGALLDGTALVLLKDGRWQLEVMQRMKVGPEDVMAAARSHMVSSVFEIDMAILERNGSISIVKRAT